jgi:hypothetical protein
MKLSIIALISTVVFASGCASSYKPVVLKSFPYTDVKTIGDSLRVSYAYDIQALSKNRRYANKERKYGYSAVALKIENTSPAAVTLTRQNFNVYQDAEQKIIMSPSAYTLKVKQRVGLHMLHALWGPWGISWSEDADGETNVSGFYIPVGAIVGMGNAIRASNANKANKASLEENEIWSKPIQSGSTLYGIISLSSNRKGPLDFKLIEGNTDAFVQSITLPEYTPGRVAKSLPHSFYVIPKSGAPFDVVTKIYSGDEKHYILTASGVKVFAAETQSLSRMTESKKQLLGIPEGDQWLFKVIEGKINAFYFLAEEDPKDLSKIQKDGGALVTFSPRALLEMVEGDPDAIELISKGKYVEAIKGFNAKF